METMLSVGCVHALSAHKSRKKELRMKKTYFAVVAVLLALMLVTCDNVGTPSVDKGNEEGLIISFRTSDGRALTTPIAAAGADYFEVVFENATRKVRTSWGNGATGRIIPGDGDYDNSGITGIYGKAYMFAGRNGTLLGVGVLVDVIEGNTATGLTVIDMTKATQVVFQITAFNTDVGGLKAAAAAYDDVIDNGTGLIPDAEAAAAAAVIDSTFKIPAGASFTPGNLGSLLLDASQTPNLTAPVFITDPGTSAIGATFDITDTAGTSFGASAHADILSAIKPVAASVAAPDPINKVICSGYLWEAGNSPFAVTSGVTTGITTSALPIPIPLSIIPGTKVGLAQVSIEIPVYLYDDGTVPAANGAAPLTWYIRGGLNNTAADLGATFNGGDGSLGGAIIIGVGEFNKNAAGLIISSKY